MPKSNNKHQPVEFTLDGVEYTSHDRKMLAADILRNFGGLDAADYDLIRVVGHGNEKRYEDTDQVEIVPRGRYVSLFTGPMPVE